jgi:signal transduction histidine kinase
VLLTMLGNAAKFTEHGQITLRVCVAAATTQVGVDALAHDGPRVVIFQISDTGIGISPEQQGQLFQEFVQADDSPTRKYGGSGLGLAISHRLCQLMGGTIAVTSAPGAGSTFTITLPLMMATDT